ncbi:MAG: DMT family transporter [Tannerella sp.]|jgi:drug/metabolite transporter (DMT)-like permease|nr:DMT family transporter [Tannerella sp.]
MTEKHPAGHGALLATFVAFGLNVPIMKSVLSELQITPIDIAFFRFSGAMLFFWIASLFMPHERVPLRDKLLIFAASFFGIFFNQFAFSIGLSQTSPIDASVINTVSPVITMLLAAFFLHEPITWVKSLGVAVGLAGALLLVLSNNFEHGAAAGVATSLKGNLLIIVSTISFVIYLTAFKNVVTRYRPVTLMKWMFLCATVCSLPFCWHDVSTLDFAGVLPVSWLKIFYVVGVATFLAYFLLPVGQKYLRPTIVSMYNYLQPIVASLVAVAVGMDVFGWHKAVATALVFLGVYIVTQSKSRAQMERRVKNNS